MKLLSGILSILLLSVSCTYEPEPSHDMLVVEGWIENESAPVVFVTSSVTSTFDRQEIQDLISHVALNATVSITCQGQTYRLHPTVSNEYLLGLYYTDNTLKGQTGGTYQIDVEWKGMHASGITTIPQPGVLDTIAVERHPDIDTLYIIKAHINPSSGQREYYRFFSKVIGQDSSYTASLGGLYDSRMIRDNEMLYVNRGYGNPLKKNKTYYHIGDSVEFKLAAMDSVSYEFWNKYNENLMFGTVAIVPYSNNIKGNLKGALGYWAGYGITTYKLRIKD